MPTPSQNSDPPPPYRPVEPRDIYQARIDRDQIVRLKADLQKSKAQVLALKEEIEIWKDTVKVLRDEVKGLKTELAQEKDSCRMFLICLKEELKKDIIES
jgi:hypothetical protein